MHWFGAGDIVLVNKNLVNANGDLRKLINDGKLKLEQEYKVLDIEEWANEENIAKCSTKLCCICETPQNCLEQFLDFGGYDCFPAEFFVLAQDGG